MSSWGVGILFSKVLGNTFLKNHANVRCFKNTNENRHFTNIFQILCQVGSWGMIHTGGRRPFRTCDVTQASLARTVASLARILSCPYCTQAFPTKSLPLPPGSSPAFSRRARNASVVDSELSTESVLQFSFYFVAIYVRSIAACICNKKLLPTFIWVSKFDVKLGSWDFFQNYPINVCVLKSRAKSIGFQLVIWSRNLRFLYFGFTFKRISFLKSYCG